MNNREHNGSVPDRRSLFERGNLNLLLVPRGQQRRDWSIRLSNRQLQCIRAGDVRLGLSGDLAGVGRLNALLAGVR